MIIYRELSSLSDDLGFSAKTLYSVSNSISSHYRCVSIAKPGGGYRELSVPDCLLKSIQRRINEKLLWMEEISPYATAYRVLGSTKKNAFPHKGNPIVLKLDIRHFFDSIIYPVVKEKVFPNYRYSEQNRVLLSLLCVYKDALPQGAPTSPAISNIIMRDFDNKIGSWCSERGVVYTRYCDDMTFSGNFDPKPLRAHVKSELRSMGFFLNDRKSVILNRGQCHIITGVLANERLRAPSDYRRRIRQEMYFCRKYGIGSHLRRIGIEDDVAHYRLVLLGRINYALSLDPADSELVSYKKWLCEND
ncbi:MAG: RNA-directed DNA polymerase [Clostridia bacterium]|nr:RNA-directed DNA polymerase [Clostridia bacterium]